MTSGPIPVSNPVTGTDEARVAVEEDELVRRATGGDEVAQRAIFDRYGERVFRLAYRLAGDQGVAEDLTQEVFVRVLDRLGQFRFESSLGTWLHRVATSVILNGLRKRKSWVRRTVPLDGGEALELRSAERPVEPDLITRLTEILETMPADQRMVLTMFDVEGYTHEEIAAALGLSAGACRMRLSRARETVRSSLGPHREDWR